MAGRRQPRPSVPGGARVSERQLSLVLVTQDMPTQPSTVAGLPAIAASTSRGADALTALRPQVGDAVSAVLSGSFRKDPPGLRIAFEQLLDSGCTVLSPKNVEIEHERDGFVYMQGESVETPESIEERHLAAISAAEFVWLFAPEGYVGLSAALEVGFAHSSGIPVFSAAPPTDPVLARLVTVVRDPSEAVGAIRGSQLHVPKAIPAFQSYYRRTAIRRGYTEEGAQQCLLLMVEEVGELARAIRKRDGLVRHHGVDEPTGLELADVFLYVIHMANILDVDLSSVLRSKEQVNHQRFQAHLSRKVAHGQS